MSKTIAFFIPTCPLNLLLSISLPLSWFLSKGRERETRNQKMISIHGVCFISTPSYSGVGCQERHHHGNSRHCLGWTGASRSWRGCVDMWDAMSAMLSRRATPIMCSLSAKHYSLACLVLGTFTHTSSSCLNLDSHSGQLHPSPHLIGPHASAYLQGGCRVKDEARICVREDTAASTIVKLLS